MSALGTHVESDAKGNKRLGGHIQVTRALGDRSAKPLGVVCDPQVAAFVVDPVKDVVLLVATDGLFDVASNTDAVRLVATTAKDPELAAKRVVADALSRGSGDNVTAAVVYLREWDESFSVSTTT